MIQIYTGDGKGKTTASIGLAVRASAHYKVLFVQFIKKGDSSEIEVLNKLENIDARGLGGGKWVFSDKNKGKERGKAKEGIEYILKNHEKYQVVVMDEAITAVDLGIIKESELIDLLGKIDKDQEIILTGRGATKTLIEKADLVTEIKKIKHYYDNGVKARKGIES